MSREFQKAPKGDKDELVPFQVKIPAWLKDKLAERCLATSQTASSLVKALLIKELGERPVDSKGK